MIGISLWMAWWDQYGMKPWLWQQEMTKWWR